jgi:hypothetical protein
MPLTQKLIESKTLASTASTVTFSSIPSTYDHLLIRSSIRTSRFNDGYADVSFYFNGNNTGTNYRAGAIQGSATSVSGITFSNEATQSFHLMSSVPTNISNYQYYFANSYILILNYKSSVVKVGRWESYAPPWASNTSGIARFGPISWAGTDPITSVSFQDNNSASMQIGSSFQLYGLVNS